MDTQASQSKQGWDQIVLLAFPLTRITRCLQMRFPVAAATTLMVLPPVPDRFLSTPSLCLQGMGRRQTNELRVMSLPPVTISEAMAATAAASSCSRRQWKHCESYTKSAVPSRDAGSSKTSACMKEADEPSMIAMDLAFSTDPAIRSIPIASRCIAPRCVEANQRVQAPLAHPSSMQRTPT